MKLFSAEFVHTYATYSFGYCNYALLEKGDTLSDVYALGYLPYSGSPDAKNLFYMARSARVPLTQFEETSENRRIGKRFDGVLERKAIPLKDFDIHNESFLNFCLAYFEERHGKYVMPKGRLVYILESGLVSTIVEYREQGHLVGYVFEVEDAHMTHFWFSFYDLSRVRQSLGMWLMLDAIRHAKKKGKTHFYTGTVYGEKALYKSNFEPLEFWNGDSWIDDLELLKETARKDNSKTVDAVDNTKEGFGLFND